MSIDWKKVFDKPDLKYKIEGNLLINLQNKLNEMEDKLLVTEVMLKKVRKENRELGRFLDDYQMDFSGLNKKLEFKIKNLAVLLEIKEENEQEIEKLKSEKDEIEKKKFKLEKQVSSSTENSSTLEEILSNKNNEIEKIKAEINQVKEIKQREKEKIREELENKISKKNDKIEELKRNLEKSKLNLEKINYEKENELETLKREIERAHLNAERSSNKTEQIQIEVQEDLSQIILDQGRDIRELKKILNLKEQELIKSTETINSLKSDILIEKRDSHIIELINDKMKIKGFVSDKELDELIKGFEQTTSR